MEPLVSFATYTVSDVVNLIQPILQLGFGLGVVTGVLLSILFSIIMALLRLNREYQELTRGD